MPNILSQEEVDALLEAVDKGDAVPDEPEEETPDEVSPIGEYDFRRPNVLTKDQLRGFNGFHEEFARETQASFSILLRNTVDIKLVSTEQQQYGDFIHSLSDVTHFILFTVSPLPGLAVMEINLSLVFGIIDLLLGGEGDVESALRNLTEVELAILNPIMDMVFEQLTKAWEALLPVTISTTRCESSPDYVQAAPLDAPVVVLTLDAKVGLANGIINLCYPLPMIQALLKEAHTRGGQLDSYYGQAESEDSRRHMFLALEDVALPLSVTLGEVELRAKDLLTLCKGDIIVFDRKIFTPLPVCVQEHSVFRAVVGTVNHHVGVKLCQPPVEKEDAAAAPVEQN